MALLTDDEYIRTAHFWMQIGGNGDYYLNISEGDLRFSVRVSTSGGNAPTDVKLAVAALYRAMEAAGLNKHPREK